MRRPRTRTRTEPQEPAWIVADVCGHMGEGVPPVTLQVKFWNSFAFATLTETSPFGQTVAAPGTSTGVTAGCSDSVRVAVIAQPCALEAFAVSVTSPVPSARKETVGSIGEPTIRACVADQMTLSPYEIGRASCRERV